MTKYLYGATIDSIQPYLFGTNKLREIAGGSELVEHVCKKQFPQAVEQIYKHEDKQQIVAAAGKVIYLFEQEEHCAAIVKNFPQKVGLQAPNLQLSQAVVKIEGGYPSKADFTKLDIRLDIQKNRRTRPHGLGLMISERSRRTGNPAITVDTKDDAKPPIDKDQQTKLDLVDPQSSQGLLVENYSAFQALIDLPDYEKAFQFPTDVNHIAPPGSQNWQAIIHADGNGLGKIIEQMFEGLAEKYQAETAKILNTFSTELDKATWYAAKTAVKKVLRIHPQLAEKDILPLRPIILGGDDLTLIIRGDLAIDFTQEFLKQFELKTKENFKDLVEKYNLYQLADGLTACAGIAYIKPKYPFHYGVDLAEGLGQHAKNIARDIARKKKIEKVPSCLVFHKIQSSFVENYDAIIDRVLTIKTEEMENGKTRKIKADYGPYFLRRQAGFNYASIQDLKNWVREISRVDAPKAGIRNWLSALNQNEENAATLMERIIHTHKKYEKNLGLNHPFRGEDNNKVTPFYDILSLASIENVNKE